MVRRIALLALCAVGASSQASIGFVNSIGDAGFGSLGVWEDFEAWSPKDVGMSSFTSNAITYSANTLNVWVASPGYTNFGISGATTTSILTTNGDEDYSILPSFTVRRIGFDTYTIDRAGAPHSVPGAPPVHVTVTSTSEFAEYDVPAGPDNFGFLGIVSTDPIVRVTWYGRLGGVRNTGTDNFRVSEVVPEPASLAVLGLAAGVLARRRRS